MKTCPQCGGSFDTGQQFCPRDGQVLNDSGQDLIGKVLDGKYEIEAFVASGGMGTVYRARHILLGDRVAIKVLLPEFRSNPEWLRRFQREGQAARRFNHPNAVAVYDLGTSSEGLVYMVMEFVEGVPLDEELRQRGRYSPEDALEVLEPVGRVLEAAHRQGVVHRDLKPANVMVKRLEGGGVWIELLDLGIAKLSDFKDTSGGDEGSPLTVAGQMLGTPYYMSPEQWGERQRDGNAEIDGRADIYSLGLIFYELVSGSRPFEAKTLVELRLFHAAINPKRLDLAVPGVPEAYARAVERAMAKDRSDRYAHAADLIEDLRAALGLPPGHATSTLAGSTSSLAGRTGTNAQSPSTLNAQATPNDTAARPSADTRGPSAGRTDAARDHANDNVKTAILTGAQSLTSPPPVPPTTPLTQTPAPDAHAAEARHDLATRREGFEPPPTLIAPAPTDTSGPANVPPLQSDAARSGSLPQAAVTNVMSPQFTSPPPASAPPTPATTPLSPAGVPPSSPGGPPAFASAPRPNAGTFGPSAPAPFTPAAQTPQQGAHSRKKSRAPLIAFIVVLLVVVCGGITGVGWFLWSKWQQARVVMTGSPPAATADTDTKPAGATTSDVKTGGSADTSGDAAGAAATGARVEALSYWIEAFDSPDQKQGDRVAQSGAMTLASGQQFKFHFSPATRGYLYVIGPGDRNAPTTFLTAEPTTGLLKTNLAAADADFSFPYGQGQVLQLDKNPGTEEYTVIFSDTPLLEPKFLSARGGHALTPAELKQLEDLRARAKTAVPAQDVKESGDGRAVSVTVPKDAASQGLVVFDVRIEHH